MECKGMAITDGRTGYSLGVRACSDNKNLRIKITTNQSTWQGKVYPIHKGSIRIYIDGHEYSYSKPGEWESFPVGSDVKVIWDYGTGKLTVPLKFSISRSNQEVRSVNVGDVQTRLKLLHEPIIPHPVNENLHGCWPGSVYNSKTSKCEEIIHPTLAKTGNLSGINDAINTELRKWYKNNLHIPGASWSFDVTDTVKKVKPSVQKAILYGTYDVISYKYAGTSRPAKRSVEDIVTSWENGREVALLYIDPRKYKGVRAGWYWVYLPAKLEIKTSSTSTSSIPWKWILAGVILLMLLKRR